MLLSAFKQIVVAVRAKGKMKTIFQRVFESEEIKNLLGDNPTRFFLFGTAKDIENFTYCVYQEISSTPFNTFESFSGIDRKIYQIDIYGEDPKDLEEVKGALVKVLENYGEFDRILDNNFDTETKLFRKTLDFNFLQGVK